MLPIAAPFRSSPSPLLRFALVYFAYWGYVGVSAPFSSLYFAARGISVTQIGVLMALVQIMRIVGPTVWGWSADRARRRVTVLRVAALGALLSYCGILMGGTFGAFFVAMLAINAFTSAQRPLSDALLVSALNGDMRRYGWVRLWGPVGFIVVAGLGGTLLDRAGIDAMPWIALAALALLALSCLRLHEPASALRGAVAPALASLLRQREVLAFFASNLLMLASHAALYVFYSLYLSRLGYSHAMIGVMWSLGALAEIVVYMCQGGLLQRFGAARMMLVCQLLVVLRCLLLGFGPQTLVWLLAAQALHAAVVAAYQSASIAVLQRWFAGPLQARGQALLNSASYGLGAALGTLAVGPVWTRFGPQAVYLTAAGCALAGALASTLSFRWQRR